MATLESARMPSLRDKQLAQAAIVATEPEELETEPTAKKGRVYKKKKK